MSSFGKDLYRRLDLDRIRALVDAYTSVRALTPAEGNLLPDLLAAHAAAQGIHVLGNWLSTGRDIADPMESYSAQEFIDIVENRSTLLHSPGSE